MEQRGKWLIGLMLGSALVLSGYAWWHQYQAGQRCAAFWGRHTAVLLRYASQVEYVPLEEIVGQPTGEAWSQGGRSFRLGTPVDISKSRGLVHARHALVDDLSYHWEGTNRSQSDGPESDRHTPEWQFLLRFRQAGELATVAVDGERGFVGTAESATPLCFVPKIATAFRKKGEEWRQLARPGLTTSGK